MHDPNRPAGLPRADLTRVTEVAGVVRQRILAGVYAPGSWIREVELQREFGLSNGPVREALQSAVADGLAERAPFRGIRVIDLSETEVVELFDVRFALLGFAAERAAERAGPDAQPSAAALKASLHQAPGDHDAAGMWLRGELSAWVFARAGNARLRDAYRRPLLQSLVYVAVARKAERDRDALLPYVLAVIDAIDAGAPADARAAVRELTQHTLRYLRYGAALHGESS